MDLKLTGRRALVTGSSGGIGAGIARRLAQEGCHVVVHGRNRDRAEKIAVEINAAGVAIGDLSTNEGAAAVFAQAVADLNGNIEILVNNAGGSTPGNAAKTPLEITVADYLVDYNANTLPAVRLTQHSVPGTIAAKWGRVIQISSAVAIQPNNFGADYTAAKAALNNFTVSLAGSLTGTSVTVNTVTPGIIMVDGVVDWGRAIYNDASLTSEEVAQRMVADKIFDLPPAGRLGTADDIAVVVCMLVSPLSGYVTGSNYRVDGGQIRTV